MDGKWFLEYADYDELETMGNEVCQTQVPLVATDERAAIAEAKLIWGEVFQQSSVYWEKHRLKPSPQVVYRVGLL